MTETKISISNLAAEIWPDRKKRFQRGSILFWQGDPVEQIHIILDGAVKISSISQDGKVISFGIFGACRVLGARSYLLEGIHEGVAEVLEPADILVIPADKFDRVLVNNPVFSSALMKELAREASDNAEKVRDLSFLDVQQRLKQSLISLAREHGIKTKKGVIIDLDITQDEIGMMISANRTTIAACLSELRSKGYLWKEGRHLAIIPPEQIEILDAMTQAVIEGNDQSAEEWANQAISMGIDALKALDALTTGMKRVDRGYSRGEIELPDVVLSASAMKEALPIIETNIELERKQEMIVGTVVIGTVFGDIHDIGKTIVAMLLRARNFRVIDLGVNVTPDQFVEAIRQYKPDIVALSALTTTTSLEFEPVIQLLNQKGLRQRIKLMVGGGAVSEEFAKRIGADGYHGTAQGAVEMAWWLITRK